MKKFIAIAVYTYEFKLIKETSSRSAIYSISATGKKAAEKRARELAQADLYIEPDEDTLTITVEELTAQKKDALLAAQKALEEERDALSRALYQTEKMCKAFSERL